MSIKAVILTATVLAFSHSASAATIVDNGTYTTVNGVDWLDLTATADMSYNDVTAQFGSGGSLEGWQYATQVQVYRLWNALGGSGSTTVIPRIIMVYLLSSPHCLVILSATPLQTVRLGKVAPDGSWAPV